MRFIAPINQHIPVWSILCGDHALTQAVTKINPSLITKPDISSPLENRLRYEVFKHKRSWIEDTMKGGFASFHIVSFTFEELMDDKQFQTCFSQVSFKRFAEEYWKGALTSTGFSIKRTEDKEPIQKTAADVDKILKMAEKLSKDYQSFLLSHENGYGYVCDLNINSQDSLVAATNRGFLLRKQDSQRVLIYDGTHRLTAYAVGKLMKMKGLPDSLNGFSWEEIV